MYFLTLQPANYFCPPREEIGLSREEWGGGGGGGGLLKNLTSKRGELIREGEGGTRISFFFSLCDNQIDLIYFYKRTSRGCSLDFLFTSTVLFSFKFVRNAKTSIMETVQLTALCR